MMDGGKVLDWDELCSRHEELHRNVPSLRCNQIEKKYYECIRDKNVSRLAEGRASHFTLTIDNYSKPLKELLFCEELQEAIDMRKHDLRDIRIRKYRHTRTSNGFFVYLRGLSKGQPSLIPTDRVVLERHNRYELYDIKKIEGDRVVFVKNEPKECMSRRTRGRRQYSHYSRPSGLANESDKFNVSFVQSGQHTYKRYHRALDEVEHSPNLKRLLFESQHELEPPFTESLCSSEELEELKERLASDKFNDQQRQAIECIPQARYRPYPYILFGPPGTGKTTTLVEAVVQVCCRMPSRKVLVCANSNSCADQLTQLIIEQLSFRPEIAVKRLVSQGHSRGRSNRPHEAAYPSDLRGARVVVTTNNMAFNLKSYELLYDYVFIDEAGHAHEAESLIPILCLKSSGALVLAGDPKQLGPVIKCAEVERLGLGQSMLERLFKFKIYQRDPIDGNYNPNYITKLLVSYRCDPRILEPSNKLFYEQELQCRGKCPDWLLRAMNFSHPLVFHKVLGQEKRIPSSASCYNEEEAAVCGDYVLKLYESGIKPEKIGVISMYQLQATKAIRQKLIEKLRESETPEDQLANICWDDAWKAKMCQIDTVDSFQGREREVIIISTVRTLNKAGSSSFLADSKRFNVAISRAKWLTIVVGHPAILDCHENWAEFGRCAKPAIAGDPL